MRRCFIILALISIMTGCGKTHKINDLIVDTESKIEDTSETTESYSLMDNYIKIGGKDVEIPFDNCEKIDNAIMIDDGVVTTYYNDSGISVSDNNEYLNQYADWIPSDEMINRFGYKSVEMTEIDGIHIVHLVTRLGDSDILFLQDIGANNYMFVHIFAQSNDSIEDLVSRYKL